MRKSGSSLTKNSKTGTVRILGYCRESTSKQFNEGFNISDQEKRIRSYTEIYFADTKYELEIVREAASASSLDRPEMKDVIKRAKAHDFDVFIVFSLDRMTRQVRDLATMLKLFDSNRIELISVQDDIDTETPMGRFFIYMIVLIAQWEEETISSRTQRGVLESARQGNYSKPGAPFGYQRDPENNKRLIVQPDEAKTVRRIFEMYSVEKKPIKTIRNELNALEANNTPWTENRINKILTNKIYYGTMVLQNTEFPNIAPPIISENEFKLAANCLRSVRPKTGKRQYMFKNYCFCNKCKKMLHGNFVTVSKKLYVYYDCYRCKTRINEKTILEAVNAEFTEIIQRDSLDEQMQLLKASYEGIEKQLEFIPDSFSKTGSNRQYLERLYYEQTLEQQKIQEELLLLNGTQKSLSFRQLSVMQKHDFLEAHVERLGIDLKSKSVIIHYKKT